MKNIVHDWQTVDEKIVLRTICHFYRGDEGFGSRLAEKMKLDIKQYL